MEENKGEKGILCVQWLGTGAFTVGGPGSTPGQKNK